jgi:hypothetical protein
MKFFRYKALPAVAATFMLCSDAFAQINPLIGTWTSALNPGTAGIIYVTLTIAPNGQLRERLMNRQGVFYDLLGTYQFDPSAGTFSYVFTDYQPRQLCSPVGCQPWSVPPGQLNTPTRALVTFPNPNLMVGRNVDGSVMNWLRAN